MKRVCNTCGNTGWHTTTIMTTGAPLEVTQPCYSCSATPNGAPVLLYDIAGVRVVPVTTLRDEPRYVLQKKIYITDNSGDYRWFTTLRTDSTAAIDTKLAEHIGRGATADQFRIIDNWN